jgi:hypothetical protein
MEVSPEHPQRQVKSPARSRIRLLGYILGSLVAITLLGIIGFLIWENGKQRGALEALAQKNADVSRATQAEENSAEKASKLREDDEESDGELKKAEDGFNVDDGCRALFYRIRDEGGDSPEAIKANIRAVDKKLRYNQVMKNPMPFYGKPIAIAALVQQATEYPAKDGSYFTDVMINWDGQPVMASAAFHTPFAKGDRVVVVGYLAGHLYHYKSIAQWDMSVPLIITRAILKPSEVVKLKA